jgi:hypothetical protein
MDSNSPYEHNSLDVQIAADTPTAGPSMGEGPSGLAETLVVLQGQAGCTAIAWVTGPSGLYAGVEGRRPRRKRLDRIKSVTLSGPIRAHERATDDELIELTLEPRPRFRSECPTGRPCPYVSCRHHLYIEVNPLTGSIQFPYGEVGIENVPYTCSLDAAFDGPMRLEDIGRVLNKTKERVRQIETKGLIAFEERGLSPSMLSSAIRDWLEDR